MCRLTSPAKLTVEQKNWVIHGDKEYNGKNWRTHWYGVKAYFDMLESKSYKMHVRVQLANYRGYALCPECRGARLIGESLLWRLGSHKASEAALLPKKGIYKRFVPRGLGKTALENFESLPGLSMPDLMNLPIEDIKRFFDVLLQETCDEAVRLVAEEIRTRLTYLIDVGVGYLTLGRQSRTLSGGRSAARQPHDGSRYQPHRHALCSGRTVRGPAPARHGPRQQHHGLA